MRKDKVTNVTINRWVEKRLDRIPSYIKAKLLAWAKMVFSKGLEKARRHPSYHDEPLQGARQGQHSIRLNRSWRAFYVVLENETSINIEIIEVNHHEY